MERRRVSRQLELGFPSTWGGRREGAGRKPRVGRRAVLHRARPAHQRTHPVHVTLRSAVRSLRTQYVFPTVRAAIADAKRRGPSGFRIVQFSVQADHIHLLVEAPGKAALSTGMRSLAISIAMRVNRLVFRKGRVFADRWHGRALTTPRAVRHALVYVLANFAKHRVSRRGRIDPYSSAPYFDGYHEFSGQAPLAARSGIVPRALAPPDKSPVTPASTWLLSTGWRRRGPISIDEVPASEPVAPGTLRATAVAHRVRWPRYPLEP